MNIEIIINVLIVLFIIASVLKRAKDAKSKSEDIRFPQVKPSVSPGRPDGRVSGPPPTPQRPSLLKEISKGILSELESTMRDETFSPGSTKRSDIRKSDQIIDEKSLTQHLHEDDNVSDEKGFFRPVEETINVSEDYSEESSMKLNFNGSAVVQGIVMSEILGPPVSLRD